MNWLPGPMQLAALEPHDLLLNFAFGKGDEVASRVKLLADLVAFFFLLEEKLRFGSVKPSPATLVRVAFDLSNLPQYKNKRPLD